MCAPIGSPQPGFLTQHHQPVTVQHCAARGVGSNVAVVLSPASLDQRTGPRHQRPGHGISRLLQHGHQHLVGHPGIVGGGRTPTDTAQPAQWSDHTDGTVGSCCGSQEIANLAVIDVPGFVADLKDHAVDHGFHIHEERHFVETYSLRQTWEVELHPEDACDGPLHLHLSLDVDPRSMLAFEDAVLALADEEEPNDAFHLPMLFNWSLPPLHHLPDLLVLATDLAGIGGVDLPIEVSAIDSTATVTDAPERTITITARAEVSLAKILMGQQLLCEELERCKQVSLYLLERAPSWLDGA